MKLIVLISMWIISFFSYVPYNSVKPIEYSNEEEIDINKSVVSIKTLDNSIEQSAIVFYKDNTYSYYVTSSKGYDDKKVYRIIGSETEKVLYTVGVDYNNKIVVLRGRKNDYYKTPYHSSYKTIQPADKITIKWKQKNNIYDENAIVSYVGECRNCKVEDGFNKFYYNLIQASYSKYMEGAAIFNQYNELIGMYTGTTSLQGIKEMVDVTKIQSIVYKMINEKEYKYNYIRNELADVFDLSYEEKYRYSIEDENRGVLITSIHYLNYFWGGLNQGMVIKEVNGVEIDNSYQLDREISRYVNSKYVKLKVRNIFGKYKECFVKI